MLSLLALIPTHITLNPSFGTFSGDYFHTTLRVPHGMHEMYTSKLIVNVPFGILVVIPEVPDEWSLTIENRQLLEHEQYVSHGTLKTTAPLRLILEANTFTDALHHTHLLNIDMQLKIGCIFQDDVSNTIWNNQYTLWWPVQQICHDNNGTYEVMSWNTTFYDDRGNSPSWSTLPSGKKPSPYLYVEPGVRCQDEHTGVPERGGLMWFNSFIPELEPVQIQESTVATSYFVDMNINTTLALTALVFAIFSFGALVTLTIIRLSNQKRFTQTLFGDNYCKCSSTTFPDAVSMTTSPL